MRIPPASLILLLAASLAVPPTHAAMAQAVAVPDAGGIGYGRHALRPPRHDLRPPPLGPDGRPVAVPDAALGDLSPDRSLAEGAQSIAARHANWCRTRYRSYDGRTDTFVPRSGAARVRCASPFRQR